MIREILSDPNGRLSAMRVMCFLILLQALFYMDWQIVRGLPIDAPLIGVLLGIAVSGKVGQRIFEGGGNAGCEPGQGGDNPPATQEDGRNGGLE
jgi:hypothetical protein